MCKFKQDFITVFLRKKSKESLTSMGSNVKLSVWINAEVFTYSEEFNFLVKERYQSKNKSLFSEFKNAKLKGKRIRKHVFTCFVRCTLKNFLFICGNEKLNW